MLSNSASGQEIGFPGRMIPCGKASTLAFRPAEGRPERRFSCFPDYTPAEIRPGLPISGPDALLLNPKYRLGLGPSADSDVSSAGRRMGLTIYCEVSDVPQHIPTHFRRISIRARSIPAGGGPGWDPSLASRITRLISKNSTTKCRSKSIGYCISSCPPQAKYLTQ